MKELGKAADGEVDQLGTIGQCLTSSRSRSGMKARLSVRWGVVRKPHAFVLAVILFAAQALSVAHYHPRQIGSACCTTATATPDNGLCVLCLLQCDSPSLLAFALPPQPPAVAVHIELYAAETWPFYSFNSYLPGRAPPFFV
jgi:hypothetical protein